MALEDENDFTKQGAFLHGQGWMGTIMPRTTLRTLSLSLPHGGQKKEWKEVDCGGVSFTGFSILHSSLIKYKREISSGRSSTNPISTCLWCSDGERLHLPGRELPASFPSKRKAQTAHEEDKVVLT